MPRGNSDSYWFRFYPDKYLGGTSGFTMQMHGAYLIMLLHQWEKGAFSEEDAINKIGQMWLKIKFKFILTERGYANVRMDEESKHKRSLSDIRKRAVQMRYISTDQEGTNVLQPVSVYVSSLNSSSEEKREPEGEGISPSIDEQPKTELEKTFLLFTRMRERIKKPVDREEAYLVMKKLRELAKDDEPMKIKILEQSIISQWPGIFPLGKSQDPKSRVL